MFADDGQQITVYSADGQQMGQAISRNGAASIRTSPHNGTVAIVRIGDKVVKVMGR